MFACSDKQMQFYDDKRITTVYTRLNITHLYAIKFKFYHWYESILNSLGKKDGTKITNKSETTPYFGVYTSRNNNSKML